MGASAVVHFLYFKVGYRLGKMPWDTGKPQPSLVAIEKQSIVQGSILDLGCGAGDNSIYLASRGHSVLGIDYSAAAIARAERAARDAGSGARFANANVFDLPARRLAFDTVLDYGLFHQFRGAEIGQYVDCLRKLLPEGKTLLLQCFSDAANFKWPWPRCISEAALRAEFGQGWDFERVSRVTYETRTHGDVPALQAVIRRTG